MKQSIRMRLGLCLLVAMAFIGVTPRMQRATANEPEPRTPQAGATEADSRAQRGGAEPSFGPVIERNIANGVLDLDTGEFILAPPDVNDLLRNRFDKVTQSTRPVEPIIRWAQSSGADLTVAMTSPDVSLILYEGLISPAGSFTTTGPEEVQSIATEALQQRGAQGKPKPPMWMFQRPGPPHGDDAFVFQTREGGIGLMQIVGSTEKPRSVKIRYKLLVTEAVQPEENSSRQLKVIRLQHLDSRELLETLKQLKLIDDNLSAATSGTNLLVLRGSLSAIKEAIGLIELLDVPPRATSGKSQAGAAASPSRQVDGNPSFEWVKDHFPPPYDSAKNLPARVATVTKTFALRNVYASQMAQDLKKQILQGRAGTGIRSSADTDNREITVPAPPDVMKRVQTFITVTDWPDAIERGPNDQYLQFTVMRTARSFFYACAIEDSEQAISNLLSLQVLAELKGDTKSKQFEDYQKNGVPDAEWEASLRADWPGKKELMQRLVREWNRYPLQRIVENGGIASNFGVKHSCSAWFVGAPKEFYYLTVEPGRPERGAREVPYYFSSLPPWWNANLDDATLKPAAAPTAVVASGLEPTKSKAVTAAADKEIAVEGALLELNSPGAITVVVSLGSDDGVKSGDMLTISRKGKRIGSLKIAKVERNRSTATILAVEEVKALEVGDQVTNQKLPAGARVPIRQPLQNPDVQRKEEVPTGTLSGRFVYDGEPPVANDLFPSFADLNIDKPQERGRPRLNAASRPSEFCRQRRFAAPSSLAPIVALLSVTTGVKLAMVNRRLLPAPSVPSEFEIHAA